MNPDLAYRALLSLASDGKVRNEGLIYFLNNASKPNHDDKKTQSYHEYKGKVAEHKLRAKKYRGELNDPTTR